MSDPMGGTGVEIELKFQLPVERRAALERALATRTAQRISLRAQYYDTPDGRLAAAQLALRLRQEGERWVQTLKGRGDGLMQRLEDEVPVPADGDAPPVLDPSRHRGKAAGKALAKALAGGASLQLLYGTDIRRLRRVLYSGGARVEVALDQGVIFAGDTQVPVCEVEFELRSGPPEGLLALAARWARRYGLVLDVTTKAERGHRLATGNVPPAVERGGEPALAADLTLSQARAAMVAAALAHALPNAAAVTGGRFEPDHVHQLRVALRRLRAALRAFGPEDEARDAALADLFAALGSTRDADVLAQTLAPAWAAAASIGLDPLVLSAGDATDAAPRALRDPRTHALWLQLIGLAHVGADGPEGDQRSWADAAARVLRRWHRRTRRLARDWGTLDDVGRHRLRKRLKRLRYLLEFSAPIWPPKTIARQLVALRPLQEQLGHWNDVVVARAHLAALPSPGAAGHFAMGWLAREAQVADRECGMAATTWRHIKAPPRPKPPRARRRSRPSARIK